jgi:CheY-like chemotaxis protein
MGNEVFRILVVDDSSDNRQALCDLLRVDGYTVDEAIDGKSAIAKFSSFQPHVVLMDVVMPEMDGLQVLQAVDIMHSATKAIVMTGNESLNDAKRAIELGAISYIGKPLRFAELRQQVQKALELVTLDLEKNRAQSLLKEKVDERTRELQEALWVVENQHQRLDTIINSISEALLAIDCNEVVMLTNHRFHTFFARPFDAVVGQNITAITSDSRFLDQLLILIRKENPTGHLDGSITLRSSDATVRSVHVGVAPIHNQQNAMIGKIITFSDQTEALRVVQLRQSFLHDVTDEMRAPLTSIASTIEVFDKTSLSPEQQTNLHTLKDAHSLLIKQVNRILDITRKETI